jgi:hypothetical protein
MVDDGGVDDVGGTGERRNYPGKLSKSWGRSKRGALVCSLMYLQYNWSFLLQVVDISPIIKLSVTYGHGPRKISLSRIPPILANHLIKNYISLFPNSNNRRQIPTSLLVRHFRNHDRQALRRLRSKVALHISHTSQLRRQAYITLIIRECDVDIAYCQ